MLFIIYLSISSGVILTIKGSDDFPSAVSSYCFKRISIGERLIGYDATRIIERNTVEECEEECNVFKCTHFSFGTVTPGNGTCELTTEREISRTQDRNFDLYQKTDECAEGKPTGYEKGKRRRKSAETQKQKPYYIVNGRHHHSNRRLYLIQACYRRIVTGKRLHERFIRHSLPCNSLQACQHQCSIEKHFICQGFNIRLDPARVGRGICELSSIIAHPDLSRDFVFDPEFAYYERDYDNGLPNCGSFNAVANAIPPHYPEENRDVIQPPISGGPYYGGDSYGPWSTGHGTIDHGPWGSHGYGSGFYESNNPSRGPVPSFHPDPHVEQSPYSVYGHNFVYGNGGSGFQEAKSPPRAFEFSVFSTTPRQPGRQGFGGNSLSRDPTPVFQSSPTEQQDSYFGYGYGYGYGYDGVSNTIGFYGGSRLPNVPRPFGHESESYYPEHQKVPEYEVGKHAFGRQPPAKYPIWDRRYDRPHRIPSYIIIDANAKGVYGEERPNYPSYKPSAGYLPVGVSPLPSFRPLSPPSPLLPPQRQPLRPPPSLPKPPSVYSFASEGPNKFRIFSSNIPLHEACFRRVHPGYKLNTNTIRGMYEAPTLLDCEAMCTNSPFKCTGYSFRYSTSENGPNCLLTDYSSLNPKMHLLPDRSCDVYFKMSSCMEVERSADTECFSKVTTNQKLDPSKISKAFVSSGISDCELACLNSELFTCRSISFRHGPSVIGETIENCFLSDWPISALTYMDFAPQANHEVYERGSFGHGCELDIGPPYVGPRPPFAPYPNIPQITLAKDHWGIRETWQHFTVNGWPCKAGTVCELNPQAGFWACEVEGGDHAQWDYCCRPKHSCGYSRGYHYPWCYVGKAGPDQWRPCSQFYYPEFGNRYQYKPVQSHNSHLEDSYGPPRDTRPWNFGSEEFGPPRYWPISYIYAEPPPNETYIWDPEEQLFYHHQDEQYQGHPDDSPRIRFKPCGNRHPYPRAIIQKLDLKNIPKAGSPEEQSKKDEKSRASKALSEATLGFSPENRDKKNSKDFFVLEPPNLGNLTESESNRTNVFSNKKEIIKEIEKIIMESTAETETERNESLKKVETKHPGFFSVSFLEKQDFWN